jgi:glycosyltransferase involved in cell wall biosynthesis
MGELISIIVPVYNAKEYLEICLNSLINQSYRSVEIILVDDGSTDGSEIICTHYADRYSNVSCTHVKNGGVSCARNIGIELAHGKYIGFVDADDYVSEKMFEELYNIMVSDKRCDLAVCEIYHRVDTGKSVLTANEGIHELFNINSFGGFSCNKLFKKEIIDSLRLRFSKSIYVCEDTLFCYQYCQKIDKIIYTKNRLYFYRKNEESAFNKSFNSKQLTVVDAFNQILSTAKYYSRDTINMIKSNYVLIVLKMCVKALLSNNKEDIKLYKMLRAIIEQHFMVFLTNKNISLKYKLFGVLIIYCPKLIRFTKYGR